MSNKLQVQLHVLTSPITNIKLYHQPLFRDIWDNKKSREKLENLTFESLRKVADQLNLDEIRQLIQFHYYGKWKRYTDVDNNKTCQKAVCFNCYKEYDDDETCRKLVCLKCCKENDDNETYPNLMNLNCCKEDCSNKVHPKLREFRFYWCYLRELSSIFLTHRNGKIALKYWESDDDEKTIGKIKGLDKVSIWNSLNRFMSTDLLVGFYLMNEKLIDERNMKGYHSHVTLADTELMKLLHNGVSETHMHQSAARHFSLNWAAIMSNPEHPVAYKSEAREALTGIEENIQRYTIQMASIRLLLALFLQRREQQDLLCFLQGTLPETEGALSFTTVKTFLQSVVEGYYEFDDDNLVSPFYMQQWQRQNSNVLYRDKREWFRFFENIQHHYRIPPFPERETLRPSWKEELAKHDILSRVFVGFRETDVPLENIFIFRCLRYLRLTSEREELDHDANPDDYLFQQLFWQYIRVKNNRLRLDVQRNELTGLDYFMRFFERGTTDISGNVHAQWGLTLNTLLQNSYLHKIELRIANWAADHEGIEAVKRKLKRKLLPFFESYEQILHSQSTETPLLKKPEIGLVLHLIKQEHQFSDEQKCYCESEYEQIQWAQLDLQNKYELEARAWSEVREEIPHMSKFLVGFDAANSEFKAQPAIFAPIFREIRDSKTTKLFDESDERIINLGLTYHVGEDFRHVMTGLRHIHEVIERFQFRAGDRLGHAIALGIDVKKWSNRQRVVYMPRVEYLDNLLWLWGFCKEYSDIHINLHRLEQLIYAQSVEIYKDNTTVRIESLYKAYVKKFNWIRDEIKDAVECQCRRSAGEYQWDIQSLYLANHCPTFLDRMNETIQVTLNDEDIDIAEQVQQKLQELVACHGIVVETNPTSNAAIGEIDDVFDHYIFSLSDVATKKRNIKVTVNTDDPVTFNTSINNEFAYIYYGLLNRGIERAVALEWIDKIRLNGMQASFIPTRQSFRELLEEVTAVRKSLQEGVLPYTVKEQSDTPKFRLQGRLRR